MVGGPAVLGIVIIEGNNGNGGGRGNNCGGYSGGNGDLILDPAVAGAPGSVGAIIL